jgi:DNA-binding MarR family transcriptional regulator
MAMLALWQHGDLSLKDLADLLHLEPPTTSPIVKRLETMRLVTRRRSAADERVLAIGLTERGRAMREDAVGIPDAMVDGLGLSLDDLRRIRDAVDTLIEATGRAGAARAPREA